jgi:hypothetical protein
MNCRITGRLIIGNPRKPKAQAPFSGNLFGGSTAPTPTGMVVTSHNKLIDYSSGYKWTGQNRIDTKYQNGTVSIEYNTKGDSVSLIMAIISELSLMGNTISERLDKGIDRQSFIEYAEPNELDHLPPPIFGQGYKKYLQIVDITNSIGDSVVNKSTLYGPKKAMLGSTLVIQCLPFARGIEQLHAATGAPIENTETGTMLKYNGDSITNYLPNPSFANDVFLKNWTVEPQATVTARTYDESLFIQDILICNDSQGFYGITSLGDQAQALGVGQDVVLSVLLRRLDGEPVVAGDIQLILAGTKSAPDIVVKSPYKINGQFYYLAIKWGQVVDYATDTSGIAIDNYSAIAVAHVQLEKGVLGEQKYPAIAANGDLMGYKWTGDDHDSATGSNTVGISNPIQYKDINIPPVHTINLWYTPLFESRPIGDNATVLKYTPDVGAEISEYYFSTVDGSFVYSRPSGGVSSFSFGLAQYNVPQMITITRQHDDGGQAWKIYINGVLILGGILATNLAKAWGGGTLMLGRGGSAIFDSLIIWEKALTGDEVLKLYQNEYPVKSGGGSLTDGIPYAYGTWSDTLGNSEGIISNPGAISIEATNLLIIGGFGGDVETEPTFEIKSGDSIAVNRLDISNVANFKQFKYKDTLYLECDGIEAINAYASNNSYLAFGKYAPPQQAKVEPGETAYLAFSVGGGGSYSKEPPGLRSFTTYPPNPNKLTQQKEILRGTITPFFKVVVSHFGPVATQDIELIISYGISEEIRTRIGLFDNQDSILSALGSYVMLPLGSIIIGEAAEGQNIQIGLRIANKSDLTPEIYGALDYIHLMPNPKQVGFIEFDTAGDVLVVGEERVRVLNSSGQLKSDITIDNRIPLTVSPTLYNYTAFIFRYLDDFRDKYSDHDEICFKLNTVRVLSTPKYNV